MAYVAKITDTSGTTGPVGSTLYGTCSTSAATAAKVVTCADFDKLITGVTIHVKFAATNSAANPTLNVNSTGAKSIYRYGTTPPTTSASWSWFAGAVVSFTYDGTGWIMNDMIGNDNTYDRTSIQTRIYAGANSVFPYSICALDKVGRFQSMTTSGGIGTSKAFNSSQKFVFPPVIFYHSPNSTIANGSVIANNVLYEQFPNVDMRYSCNITTESGFTQYKPIYIECRFDADGFWYPIGITQTFTTGRYYILLGGPYNTSIYQLALWTQHPVFYAVSSSEIIPYQNEHKTALVFDNSEDWDSYPWHKFASVVLDTAYDDSTISFIVSTTSGAVPKSLGILTAHVRTGSTKVKEAAEFEWTLAGNNVDPSLFTMVYTDTANTSCAVELYCKPNSRYTGLSFTVLQEESRESVSTKWNLVRYATTAHGIATLPTGTGQVVSSLITIAATGVGLYNSTFKNTLQSATLTAAATQTFPATGGTVLNTGTTSFTQSLSSGTKIGSIKINGTSTDMYAPTNTNTTYTLSGAYGTNSDTWVTTLTPSSGTATTSTVPKGTTSAYGLMKLSDSTSSTSTALAATANAVKTAYDLANGKSVVTASASTVSGATAIKSISINGTNYNIYDSGNTDTKVNVTLATTTKAYLLGTSTTPTSTAQAVTSVADTGVYLTTTAGHLQATVLHASAGVNCNTANSNSAGGLALYGTDPATYGVMFRGTSSKGVHGYVQSDWATYFTMNNADTRGWIFHKQSNVASISGAGNAVFNGSVTVGGNATNTSGCRMVYNSTTQSLDFVFV